jgi:hypothetical protein
LSGSFAEVTQVEGPDIPPPTEPAGTNFYYDVRTNNFASVSGYFHVDRIFRTMQDLGFDVGAYMSNTVFPIPVDIRCFDIVNAHCVGDGMGGIGHAGYGIMDTSIAGDPLGRACDPRVHLHEVLGHGILYEAVDSLIWALPTVRAIRCRLIYSTRTLNARGLTAPLASPATYVSPTCPGTRPSSGGATVAAGWAWNGSRDDGGYGSEEILATTLFNFYRSIGGDHPNLGRRQFASRMAMYLILRAIGDLTPATDPQYARDFASALMAADALNWTSEGVFGGAYHKVIRWVRSGDTDAARHLSAAGRDDQPREPPEVDVYIDRARASTSSSMSTGIPPQSGTAARPTASMRIRSPSSGRRTTPTSRSRTG